MNAKRFVFLLLALLIAGLVSAQAPQLLVHFIDVGQGDSILIETPDHSIILIDGGEDNQALLYLQSLGVDHIDALIASHPHADHIGGLIPIMETIPVSGVWTSGALHTTYTFEQFIDTISRQHIPYHEVAPGDTIPAGDLTLDVLSDNPDAELNDSSMVLRLQYGQVSFLFTGDAEADAEAVLLRQVAPERLAASVLKVAHHGSATSSSLAFLN